MSHDPARRDPDRQPEQPAREEESRAGLTEDDSLVDDARHYLQDPDGLRQNARDADEQHQDDLLEIDQTELEELGLVLDDPHQPEPE